MTQNSGYSGPSDTAAAAAPPGRLGPISIHCITIRATQPEPGLTDLNHFIGSQRVVNLQSEFVSDGADLYPAFCLGVAVGPCLLPVALLALSQSSGRAAGDNTAPVYKKILNEANFARFASLRELCKQVAQRGGSWKNDAGRASAAYRIDNHRGNDWNDNGSRLLLSSPAQAVALRSRQRSELRGRASNIRGVGKPQGPRGTGRSAAGGFASNVPREVRFGVSPW